MPSTDLYSDSFTIPEKLHVGEISFDGDLATIYASMANLAAECPLCEQPSRWIHGCYVRTLADLLWCGKPVRLRIRVRKFFCAGSTCERRIFAGRLGEVALPSARGTDRQREALEWIAFALGGEAGARLDRELGLLVSPDTLGQFIVARYGNETVAAERRKLLKIVCFRIGNEPSDIIASVNDQVRLLRVR